MSRGKRVAVAILACTLASCALLGGKGEAVVYPVTAAQADKILSDSLAEEFGIQSIHRLSYPYVGYRVETGAEAILAVRIPAVGRGENGDVNGFLFEIKLRGTPPAERVQAVSHRIVTNGSEQAAPLPLVRRID